MAYLHVTAKVVSLRYCITLSQLFVTETKCLEYVELREYAISQQTNRTVVYAHFLCGAFVCRQQFLNLATYLTNIKFNA